MLVEAILSDNEKTRKPYPEVAKALQNEKFEWTHKLVFAILNVCLSRCVRGLRNSAQKEGLTLAEEGIRERVASRAALSQK